MLLSSILSNEKQEENLSYNLSLLKSRFHALYKLLQFEKYTPLSLLGIVPKEYELTNALKDDAGNLTLKINDKYIHSKYNPILEAKKAYSGIVKEHTYRAYFCFFGLGLGYIQELFMQENKTSTIIVIEPDIFVFILFLASRKLKDFFSHNSLILIPATPPSETISILENLDLNISSSFYFKPDLEISHPWLEEFNILKERHQKKHSLNCNTLKKFYVRWLKNFIKNLDNVLFIEGISILKDAFLGVPSIIFAAGPSLDEHISYLKDVQSKALIIALDTSFRVLLEKGITPDFVVLMDGQYLNYLHIAGINASSSILITEGAVYPSVFYENFKKIYLASSFFPLGKYIEDSVEVKGHLSAGGSVATTAWDLARFMGSPLIIMAGLDLAFTQNKTHSSACKFEKEAVLHSNRFKTLENITYKMLDIKNTEKKEGYEGQVLTDSKMKMFAWWFESKIAEYPEILTYNFMAHGLKIPNMASIQMNELLGLLNSHSNQNKKEIISAILSKDSNKKRSIDSYKRVLKNVFKSINFNFNDMKNIAKEALNNADSFMLGKTTYNNMLYFLQKHNEKIKKNELYMKTGFDVVIKGIESEMEDIFKEKEGDLRIAHIKKIIDYYLFLISMLEKSVNLIKN